MGSVASVPNTEFDRRPRASLPLKMAKPDTDGKKNRYARTALFKSASSYALCTVSGVGYPPANSYRTGVASINSPLPRP